MQHNSYHKMIMTNQDGVYDQLMAEANILVLEDDFVGFLSVGRDRHFQMTVLEIWRLFNKSTLKNFST